MGAAYIPSSMNIKALLAVALLVVALTAAFDNRVDEDFLESNPESSLAQALPPSKPKCHKKCASHKKCRKHYVRIPGKIYKRCLWHYMKNGKKKKMQASLAQALPPRPMKIVMGPQRKSCKKAKKMKGYKCYCPSTMKKGLWLNKGRHKHAQDIFKVTTKGQGVQVKRVDNAGKNCHGWGMNLTFMCKCRRLPKGMSYHKKREIAMKKKRKTRRTICRRYFKWVRAKKHKIRCVHKKVVKCRWHKTNKKKL